MPEPRRSKSFGGSSSHQRLMMANLAASLFAAEGIETTEAKAKALRPIAERLITKAKKAQNSDAGFIAALAGLVRRTAATPRALCSFAGARQCPKNHKDCPHAKAAA
ncbi:MAG: hypothetical protein EBV41_04945 [Actinobacteria bacterium]|nr:hypothetical protein [Actinomycetota bacterium]